MHRPPPQGERGSVPQDGPADAPRERGRPGTDEAIDVRECFPRVPRNSEEQGSAWSEHIPSSRKSDRDHDGDTGLETLVSALRMSLQEPLTMEATQP